MTEIPSAPTYADLPTPRKRAYRGSAEARELKVHLKVITSIMGGSFKTREIDDIDVIRVPTVRGHLRFWWRALYASDFTNSEELYQRESELWGAASGEEGGRSAVEIHIKFRRNDKGEIEESVIGVTDRSDFHPSRTEGAYALWPARRETNRPGAPRRKPGTKFELILKIAGTSDDEEQVRNTLRAWILFGGYGGRTRRGLGSLTVLANQTEWLPSAPTRDAINELFGRDIFSDPRQKPGDVPWLAGASLHIGNSNNDPERAWTTALEWLREFRQGYSGREGDRARESGAGKEDPRRPSISNWPEADKIRHLTGKTKSHPPRHNSIPAWPRAGFGLPINGQFQTSNRSRGGMRYDEPGPFEIRWGTPQKGSPSGYEVRDRLASPLIVKALPLANGAFVPSALWLNRAYPQGGEVIVNGDSRTAAPFDRLVAAGDKARFGILEGRESLRQAFLAWIQERYNTKMVAK